MASLSEHLRRRAHQSPQPLDL